MFAMPIKWSQVMEFRTNRLLWWCMMTLHMILSKSINRGLVLRVWRYWKLLLLVNNQCWTSDTSYFIKRNRSNFIGLGFTLTTGMTVGLRYFKPLLLAYCNWLTALGNYVVSWFIKWLLFPPYFDDRCVESLGIPCCPCILNSRL